MFREFTLVAYMTIAEHANEIATAMVGVAGVVIGTLLASRSSRKLQQDSRAHENEVRFHDSRLRAYANFLQALNLVIDTANDVAATTDRAARIKLLNKHKEELFDLANHLIHLRLLATPNVFECADSLAKTLNIGFESFIDDLHGEFDSGLLTERTQALMALLPPIAAARDSLRRAMREELGVDRK